MAEYSRQVCSNGHPIGTAGILNVMRPLPNLLPKSITAVYLGSSLESQLEQQKAPIGSFKKNGYFLKAVSFKQG